VLYLSIVSIIAACFLFFLAFFQRRKAGIPAGQVIYTDSSQWRKVEKPLFDGEIRLTGKPDYLVHHGKQVIPIEVKSGRAPHQPSPWHVSQLAAYCLLVKSEYGTQPSHGILHYNDRTIALNFTSSLEKSTLAIIQEMQQPFSQIHTERSHHDRYRCRQCGYRSICDQALRI
jgi:CRISPR-associated exonuclease Cas4